jgi:hypothetical protein
MEGGAKMGRFCGSGFNGSIVVIVIIIILLLLFLDEDTSVTI